MLVLSRKPGEAIHIGDNVFIRVIQTSSGGVRLGIVAPEDVTIVREELLAEEVPFTNGANVSCITSASTSNTSAKALVSQDLYSTRSKRLPR